MPTEPTAVKTNRWAGTSGDARLRHLVESVAVLVGLGTGPVLSHESAACYHELVLPRRAETAVRLTDANQWRRGRGFWHTRW